jgi:peptide/nickel transport system permease protein
MINAARLEMAREPMVWWALLAAFGFMFTLVLSANLFADAVQNALDPRTRTLKQKNNFFQRLAKKQVTPVTPLTKTSEAITPSESSHRS